MRRRYRNMKAWKVAVIAGLVIALAAGAGVALAQGEDPPADCCGPRGKFRRHVDGDVPLRGAPEDREGPFIDREVMHDLMQSAIAEALEMSVEELESLMETEGIMMSYGGPYLGVILAQGLSEEDARTLLKEAHRAAIEKAVEQGLIDEEIAEHMLEHVRGGPEGDGIRPREGMRAGRGRGLCDPEGSGE
jgi:hypothetical protein